MLPYVVGVSWPRSGHHLLVNLLAGYFGEEFRYCEFYGPQLDCCRKVPCARAGQISLSKNHDRELSVPKLPDQLYLIQFRRFVPSTISNYELAIKKSRKDSAAHFRIFAGKMLQEYADFMNKWGDPGDTTLRALRLPYEELVKDFRSALKRSILLFQPNVPIDQKKVEHAISSVRRITVKSGQKMKMRIAGVRPKKEEETQDFRFFDAGFFSELEAQTNHLYEAAIQKSEEF